MGNERHYVRVRLSYLAADLTLSDVGDVGVPYKWRGTCACGWSCMSWQWMREDGSGALAMADQHARTGEL